MNYVEFTDDEIRHLVVMLKIAGFREKRDYLHEHRAQRTEGVRIMGRILKKLRKAKHLP